MEGPFGAAELEGVREMYRKRSGVFNSAWLRKFVRGKDGDSGRELFMLAGATGPACVSGMQAAHL